jgi:hypothetical protein
MYLVSNEKVKVAKVKSDSGVIENVEVVTESWLQQHFSDEYVYVIVESTDAPHIGLKWSESDGFEQPKKLTEEEALLIYNSSN